VILEEEDEDAGTERPSTPQEHPQTHHTSPPRDIPRLRRAASHESIISVHGADIHTLQSRPSQLLVGRRMFSAGSPATSQPVLSGTSATAAISTSRSPTTNDSHSYLSTLAANQRGRPAPLSKKSSMGQLGSWVMGRWGYSPALPPQPVTATTAETASISSAGSGAKASPGPPRFIMRPPGINQKGPIFGFGPEPQLPRAVVTTQIDEEALKDSLGGGGGGG
jgi:hypothetical protein